MSIRVDLLILLLAISRHTFQQQYRLVPTCSDENLDAENPIALKGEKGDQGMPGKAGPPGVGPKGEIGDCDSFQMSVEERLDRLEVALREVKESVKPTSCSESAISGVQTLRNGDTVLCDQRWTVFQRRFNGSVSFDRPWLDYKNGFGSVHGEYWMGLEKIHFLTRKGPCRLRVDLWDFDDDFAFAEYSIFSVKSELLNYTLELNGYSGTAGDSLNEEERQDGQQFSTFDRDNDKHAPGNCAALTDNIRGGGWFHSCFRASLNNQWGRSVGSWTKIVWAHWKGSSVALEATTMKLRCD